MPITGTSKRGPAVLAQAAPTIRLKDLLDQLEHEYSNLRLEEPSDHEVALRAYFHTACHVALHWVGGNPYRWAVPETFQGERLWKLCLYLRSLDPENSQALKEARAAQLTQLRGPAWENYQAICIPSWSDRPYTNGEAPIDREILPFTWEGIDTLWQTDEYLKNLPADKAPDYLPRFANRASEDWHLVALAVLFLNRACKLRLADLHPYPTGDGHDQD